MQPGEQQRQEEHRQKLRVYAAADLGLCHTDLLHDLEPLRILIALGKLLIVDDEHRRADEHEAECNSEEEQTAIDCGKVGVLGSPRFVGQVLPAAAAVLVGKFAVFRGRGNHIADLVLILKLIRAVKVADPF